MKTERGFVYLQYVGRHETYGDTVRVLPGFFEGRPANPCRLAETHAYFAFYPVALAARRGLVTQVASCGVPAGLQRPARLRRAGMREPGGRVRTWVIETAGQGIVRTSLTDEEKRLPIAAVWNHEFLIQRLTESWLPQSEG